MYGREPGHEASRCGLGLGSIFFWPAACFAKRALQSLAVTALLAVPAILWISQVAPHWPSELHANLATITARGGLDDPGPHSGGAFGVNMIICL